MELHTQNCLTINDATSEVVVRDPLPSQLDYLAPAYERTKVQSPTTLSSLVENYITGLTETPRTELFDAIGTSLITAGVATASDGGIPIRGIGYIPQSRVRNDIINRLRTELVIRPNQQPAEDETVLLAVLLQHGKLFAQYFSKPEQKQLKEILTQYRQTESNTSLTHTINQIDAIMNVPVITALIASTGN